MYNILICDDEQDIVNALKIYLSGGDYCLFEASNGREALEVVEKNDIHLILMDIMMPQLDGIAATAKLREKSNVPIILLTAKSESSDKVLGLNTEDAQVDAGDDSTIELAPGAIVDLNEGEKAHDMNPGRPNTAFDGFVVAICRQIGAALEIPYFSTNSSKAEILGLSAGISVFSNHSALTVANKSS